MARTERLSLACHDAGNGPRRALVLSGGGMRLSYQAGVLAALEEAGLSFRHIDATSGGSLNLAMLLGGLAPTEMIRRWTTLDLRRSLSLMPIESYLRRNDRVALGSADGFLDHVFPHLGIDIDRVRRARDIAGTFNVFNYSRKVNEAIPHERMSVELLVAGLSLPGVLPPVRTNGALYLDSAFARDANLVEAVRRGAEEIWLVWCLGNTDDYRGGVLEIYIQMLEMAANASLNRDFEDIAALNARIAAGDSPHGQRGPIRLHVIRPAHPLPLDTALYTGAVTAQRLVEQGHADASAYLQSRTDAGLPPVPETMIMTTPAPGISFTETMQGPFALGADDPAAGGEAASAAGTSLAMHVTVTVRDMDRFVADPEHRGTLRGHIDFAPWGTGLPTGEGVFKLFSPAATPGTRLMVYELPFRHDGQEYYLAGRKEVRDDSGFDMWSDTTTLLTRLHRGTDASGPVVGAGVLRLGPAAFARVAASVRAVDTRSPMEGARLVARFARFFAGNLWRSYVRTKLA